MVMDVACSRPATRSVIPLAASAHATFAAAKVRSASLYCRRPAPRLARLRTPKRHPEPPLVPAAHPRFPLARIVRNLLMLNVKCLLCARYRDTVRKRWDRFRYRSFLLAPPGHECCEQDVAVSPARLSAPA